MDFVVAVLTAGIGIMVILAALYLQSEGKPRRMSTVKVRGSNFTPKGTVQTKHRKRSKTKKGRKKSSSKKEKRTAVETPKAAKKTQPKKKKEDLAQAVTSNDGITGLSGSTFSEGRDADGWNVVQTKSRNSTPRTPVEDNRDAVTIDCHNIPKLVGSKGATIRDIQDRHSVKIDTPDRSSSSKKVTIKGEKANVEACIAEINDLIGPAPVDDGTIVSKQKFAKEHASRVIGKGGNTVQRISAASECEISVKTDRGFIEYRGTPEAVAKAKELVQEIVAEAAAAVPETREQFRIKKEHVGLIIGAGGQNVRKLEQNGAKIDCKDDLCIVSGSKAATAKTVAAIKKLIKTAEDQVSQTIPLQENQIGVAIGRDGSTVKEVRKDTGASVRVNGDQHVIEIRGSKKQVAKAVAAYKVILAPREQLRFRPLPDGVESKLISVPASLVGSVIGRNGSTLNGLRDETKAHIDFSKNKSDQTDNCRLAGTAGAIATAEAKITEIVAKLEAKEAAQAEQRAREDDEAASAPPVETKWEDVDGDAHDAW